MATDDGRPLSGWRVLDLGIITAGAATSALLADAGAEVVKIESERYPDPFRAWTTDNPERWPSPSPAFDFTNRNKWGLALDLKTPEGRDTFLAMAERADVVVENFRRGVLDSLGIGWAELSRRNPRLVLASISSQGETGPDRLYTSYGSTLEATGGLAAVTGYDDGKPVISGRNVNYPDQIVSICAMGLIIAAGMGARAGGRGAHLDISQREVTSFLVGETIAAGLAAPLARPEDARRGNADPGGGRRGCVRVRGGRWLALEIPDGGPTVGEVGAALSGRTEDEALAWARENAIAAVPVLDSAEVSRVARGRADGAGAAYSVGHALRRDPEGRPVKGFPFQSRRRPLVVHSAAPRVGQHSQAVLARWLGPTIADGRRGNRA